MILKPWLTNLLLLLACIQLCPICLHCTLTGKWTIPVFAVQMIISMLVANVFFTSKVEDNLTEFLCFLSFSYCWNPLCVWCTELKTWAVGIIPDFNIKWMYLVKWLQSCMQDQHCDWHCIFDIFFTAVWTSYFGLHWHSDSSPIWTSRMLFLSFLEVNLWIQLQIRKM